jgi:hypothetical protein
VQKTEESAIGRFDEMLRKLFVIMILWLPFGFIVQSFFISSTAWAQTTGTCQSSASNRWVVPTSANNPGQFGAIFKTRITLFNPTSNSFPIAISLYNTIGPVLSTPITIQAGQTLSWDNFLQTFFNYQGAGTLIFDSSAGGSTDNVFIIYAEVYSDSVNGRYKTIVANGTPISAVGPTNPAYTIGINVSNQERTNIGCFNDSTSPNNVFADVYDATGNLLQTISFNLVPHGWLQQSCTASVAGGYILWRSLLPVYAYMVVVDNTSNDGSFSIAMEYGGSGSGGGGGRH